MPSWGTQVSLSGPSNSWLHLGIMLFCDAHPHKSMHGVLQAKAEGKLVFISAVPEAFNDTSMHAAGLRAMASGL